MIEEWDAHPIGDRAYSLAEGPAWEEETGLLRWVDIDEGVVWAAGFDGERLAEPRLLYRSDAPVGFCIRRDSGGLVVPRQGRLVDVRTGNLSTALFPDVTSGRRFNDAIADSEGRIVAGTLTAGADDDARDEQLARLERDGTWTTLREGVGLSNGLAFSPDRRWLYHVDTTAHTVSFSKGPGFHRWAVLFVVDDGYPDGMTVDATGNLWVAIWGSGEVRRYTPSGELTGRVHVAARQVTSCAFAGPDLATLVITSASVGLPPRELDREPATGHLFAVHASTLR